MPNERAFRRRLLAWYETAHRKLPWRSTTDPYRVWVSEIMLQQTRAAAVIPYYERFLERFPDISTLASAPEQVLLERWSGLGYYSRARNLQKAAQRIVRAGGFPSTYDAIRTLEGVGDYTAAAVASICFALPHAVVDGNVLRVLSRITDDAGDIRSTVTRRRIQDCAERLLDRQRPGPFNQALMELGATICVPRRPRCGECPVVELCVAHAVGTQNQLPVKLGKQPAHRIEKSIYIVERKGRLLVRQRPADARRLAGFWELPEDGDVPKADSAILIGEFRHSITNHNYRFAVYEAGVRRAPPQFIWLSMEDLLKLPLTTATRKALKIRVHAASR